ncbi:MAG: O-antigen ligase family protein [Lachnospiraceae bacterium]|nr:O-antigen ligase family protein [Lachnospiraceae bacterium]MCM1238782.1 O-antigen ligase family protein [Lachnospiraceae bacterium]
MRLKIKLNGIVYFVLWLWIFTNCFTGLDADLFLRLKGTNSSLHIHNILAIFLILLALSRKEWKFPKGYIYVFLFFIEMTLIWLINLSKYGVNSGYISTVYGIVIMACVAGLSDCIDEKVIKRIFESVALVVAVLIMSNILIHMQDIVRALRNGWAHPTITVFFGGGVNLEATWMAMFGVFFRDKWKYKYWLFSSLLSVVYISRTGMMLNVLLILIYLYQDNRQQLFKRILVVLVLVGMIFSVSYSIGLLDNVLKRFSNIGNEAGSRARLIMWEASLRGIFDNPLGVGCGNAMDFLSSAYNLHRSESNVHNIYLQCLLENNIVGFSMLIGGIFKLVCRQLKNRFSDPCGMFLLLYAFQGFFQTTLKDPLMFLVLAFYFVLSGRNRMEEKSIRNI